MEYTVTDIPLSLKFFRVHDAEIRIEPFIWTEPSCKRNYSALLIENLKILPITNVIIATTIKAITVEIQTSLLKGSRKEKKLGGACLGLM